MKDCYDEIEINKVSEHIRNGLSVKQSKERNGLPITRIETIWNEVIDANRVGYAGINMGEKDGWLLKEGDILISHINSKAHLGKCALYGGFPEKLIHGMNLLCLRPNTKRVVPNFLTRFLQSPQFRAKIPSITKDSVNQSSFNISNFKKLTIPLPPLPEQKRIAAILDKADAIRRKRQQAIQLANEFLRSTFLDMFGDPVINPKGWKLRSLGSLTSKIGSGATPRGGKSTYINHGISLIRSLNIHDDKFLFKDLAHITEKQADGLSNVVVEKSDVLLNITGASVCRCAVVIDEILPARVNQHVCIIRPNKSILASQYLLHCLISKSYKQKLLAIAGAGGATREALTKQQVENLKIPLPPMGLQDKFTLIKNSLHKINYKSMRLSEQPLFNSLSQRAFRGEL